MYKLTIIAGPNRGQSYSVDGELSIGRVEGNTVVLQSQKVSKRHCVLVVDNGRVTLKDQGSSNGTFVNGALTKLKSLSAGDRISVGEYVLELTNPQPAAQRSSAPHVPVAFQALGNVLQFPAQPNMPVPGMAHGVGQMPDTGPAAMAAQVPQDLLGKVLWHFENYVMPFFYGFTQKNQWRHVSIVLFGAVVAGNLFLSVRPLLQSNRQSLMREVGKRALFIAREIAERNAPMLAAGTETKTEIGLAEHDPAVRLALLIDMDNRIIAPAAKLNQHLAQGDEARFAVRASQKFRAGEKSAGMLDELDESTMAAVWPVKVYNPQLLKESIIGMAVVSIDASLSVPDGGTMGVVYSETLIFTAILGGLILLVLYRLTLKPFEVLNDDLDKALKGEITQVTREFCMEEIEPLYDVINSALQRLPKTTAGGMDGGGASITIEDFLGPLRMMGDMARFAVLVCDADRKIVYMNTHFEDISGIRSDNALGQDIPSVARDQSFGPFTGDLFDRVVPGGHGTSEEYEFSGERYMVMASALGGSGQGSKGFLLTATKKEE
jgi:hypothetical protein